MTHEVFIPAKNWTDHLADAIENSKLGEVTQIVVRDRYAKELGERAHARMCPAKDIRFVIRDEEP